MNDKQLWIVMVGIIVVFLAGVIIEQIVPHLFAAVMAIVSVGILYLAWRLVRAVERIADAMERGEMTNDHSEPSSENRS